jgi:hypothetical protein
MVASQYTIYQRDVTDHFGLNVEWQSSPFSGLRPDCASEDVCGALMLKDNRWNFQ